MFWLTPRRLEPGRGDGRSCQPRGEESSPEQPAGKQHIEHATCTPLLKTHFSSRCNSVLEKYGQQKGENKEIKQKVSYTFPNLTHKGGLYLVLKRMAGSQRSHWFQDPIFKVTGSLPPLNNLNFLKKPYIRGISLSFFLKTHPDENIGPQMP